MQRILARSAVQMVIITFVFYTFPAVFVVVWLSSRTPEQLVAISASISQPDVVVRLVFVAFLILAVTVALSYRIARGRAEAIAIPLDELREMGLYAALRNRGVRPVVAQQTIGARMPTPTERKHLAIRGQQPVLTMSRMAFDASGKAVEFGDHCYRAEDYSIDIMVDER